MNKNKVIIHINNVSKMLDNTLSTGTLQHIQGELNLALSEIQKPDWISVEDELPSIGMRVWVCNIKNPNVIVSDYRSEAHNCKFYDGYGFLIGNHVTHWRKIDKLEV